MSGWIALHRGWRDCEAFEDSAEPLSEREAWVWLLENAAWKDTRRRNMKGERIDVRRGQYHTSLRTLGEAFGWGKNKVARYLEKLASFGMIGTASGQSGLLISICNYEKYQEPQEQKDHSNGTASGQSRDTQQQRKQESFPNGKGADAPRDVVKDIFDLGVSLLTEAGQSPGNARSLIGKWRKSHKDGPVLEALVDCQARRISNPVEWMPRRLSAAGPRSETALLIEQSKRYTRTK